MHLTRYTDYGLRVLIHLAVHPDDLVTIADVADAYAISRNHLMKVVQQLGRTGFVETIRGKRGGMRLTRPPAEIRVGAVVRAMEADLHLVECFGKDGRCVIAAECRLRQVLGEALEAFLGVLDRYTLADISQRPDVLRELLGTAVIARAAPA